MSSDGTAVVVGAGIVGASCALALTRAGFRVTVVDAGAPGCGATAEGMGHLVVMDDSPAQLSLTSLSLSLWREIFPALPASCEVDRCGTLWIAEDAAQLSAAAEKREVYARAGVSSELLDAASVRACEPELRADLAGALRVPDDAVIYPPAAAAALLGMAVAQGCEVIAHWRAESITDGVVYGPSERISADVIVNAAGTGAVALSPGVGIRARRGHLVITDRYPGRIRHQLVELGYLTSAHTMSAASVAFNAQPRRTGQLLIGSSREFGEDQREPSGRVLSTMLARAIRFLPALANMRALRSWVGFRPATADKLPLIGRWPDQHKVWICAGHEGLGITTALGSAHILVRLITGTASEAERSGYNPTRVEASQWN